MTLWIVPNDSRYLSQVKQTTYPWRPHQTSRKPVRRRRWCFQLASLVPHGVTDRQQFVPPFGDLGVTYMVHLWLVGKRMVDFLLVQMNLFRQLSRLRHYERILVKITVFERGWVIWAQISGECGSPTNDCWLKRTRVPGLSRGVVCVILRLPYILAYKPTIFGLILTFKLWGRLIRGSCYTTRVNSQYDG